MTQTDIQAAISLDSIFYLSVHSKGNHSLLLVLCFVINNNPPCTLVTGTFMDVT